ncbi:hypothetical protein WN982_40060 [Paraburkholderia sp. IMGN_8]|uniref:hypothetical protein n=1 Tax=Paraburkholderia sp. IMGN_8 TaxID=3136564 RepID=UPI0031010426
MTFREEIERQALMARREMVRSKELLTSSEFCERLGVSERRLARMISTGSVFSIAVDDVQYFPALLTDPSVDRRRLQSVCRILVPAPPDCRLGYLSSMQGNLGGLTPLAALAEYKSYRHLRQMARAYAADWSRTVVNIWAGHYRPEELEPTYVAAVDVDPRTNLWKRALEAMEAGGYIAPPGPYPSVDAATVLVIRSEAGDLNHVEEARLDVSIVDEVARVLIYTRDLRQELEEVPVAGADSIVEVVRRVVAALSRVKKRQETKSGH